jgi:hypothetical protein
VRPRQQKLCDDPRGTEIKTLKSMMDTMPYLLL